MKKPLPPKMPISKSKTDKAADKYSKAPKPGKKC